MLQRSETKTAISRVGYPDRIRYVQMVGRACRPTREKPPVQILTIPDCSTMGVKTVKMPDWYGSGKFFVPPEELSNGQVRVDRGQGLEYWKIGERGSNHSLNDGLRDSKWRAADRWAMNKLRRLGSAASRWSEGVADAVNYLISKVVAPVILFMVVFFAMVKAMLFVAGAIAGVDL